MISILVLIIIPPLLSQPPNILLIMVDDLGWGDVGWNNPIMADVTPTLDKLAKNGVILSQYYVQQVCTPSRVALMTGMYPFHIGHQKQTIKPLMPTGLTLNRTLLPEQLSRLGYKTHMVGKWHLGFCRWEYTPTMRGFHSFFGFYTGAGGHFSHIRGKGYDFRRNTRPLPNVRGVYSTSLLTDKAVDIIEKNNYKKDPLFLYLSFQAVHAPLEVPDKYLSIVKSTGNKVRDVYRAMVYAVDEGVGRIVRTLKRVGEWRNTVLVFTTDNGGAVSKGGNNHPLRGTKGTLFEGGTRGVAFISGGRIARSGVVSSDLVHITDWYPTILAAAGDSEADTGIDGINQWGVIDRGEEGTRKEMVYNLKIKPLQGAIRMGKYKLMFSQKFHKDKWFNIDNKVNNKSSHSPHLTFPRTIFENTFDNEDFDLEKKTKTFKPYQKKNANKNVKKIDAQILFDKRWSMLKKYLFNLDIDPEERYDLKKNKRNVVEMLRKKARDLFATIVPADFPDPVFEGKPKYFNNIWSPGWC